MIKYEYKPEEIIVYLDGILIQEYIFRSDTFGNVFLNDIRVEGKIVKEVGSHVVTYYLNILDGRDKSSFAQRYFDFLSKNNLPSETSGELQEAIMLYLQKKS